MLKKRRSINFFNFAKSSVVPTTCVWAKWNYIKLFNFARSFVVPDILGVRENEPRQILQLRQVVFPISTSSCDNRTTSLVLPDT